MASAYLKSPIQKLYEINWLLITLAYVIGGIGVAMIFSATDGVVMHGAFQHFTRLILAGLIMLTIALTDIKVWYRLAYPLYGVALVMLLAVDIFGVTVNGAQRWLDLYFLRLQPSEIMKVAIVLAVARYYHDLPAERVSHILGLLGALILVGLPIQFILRQPDLGTALLVISTVIVMIYLAGINWRVIASAFVAAMIVVPLFIRFGLKEYQRSRILTFFDPERDPTGASYHIAQSKIALGSGGLSGKGFMEGTQRQLEYVPENRTDFIFTVIGEEFGLMGCLITMAVYMAVIGLCIWLALQCKNLFSQLLILGLSTTFALYIIFNLAMVMGLMPVVGVPLPLISYGGTVILIVMASFGLIMSAHVHRLTELPRSSGR